MPQAPPGEPLDHRAAGSHPPEPGLGHRLGQFDETSDGRRLKLASIIDEHTREALACGVDRACDADELLGVIDALVADRGASGHLRMDNGPELIAWALRTGVA